MHDPYRQSIFLKKIRKQQFSPPYTLFSDLDDTYVRKYRVSPEKIKGLTQKEADLFIDNNIDSYQDTVSLYSFLLSKNIPLGIVSGRDIYMFRALQQVFKNMLPQLEDMITPDLLIGAVGTEIWVLQPDGSYRYDQSYEKHLMQKSGFEREAVYSFAQKLVSFIKSLHPSSLIRFQKRDRKPHSPHEFPPQKMKVSLEFEAVHHTAKEIYAQMREFAKKQGLEKLMIVVSLGHEISQANSLYYVDLLPCAKAEPVNFLSQKYNLKPLVAGDGGNDADMIINTKGYGIVVGGYKKDLMDAVGEQSAKREIYVETDNKRTGPASIEHAVGNLLLRTARK